MSRRFIRVRPPLRQRLRPGRLPFRPRRRRGGKLRLLIGAAIALFAIVSFFGSRQYNPVTGEKQFVALAPHQEIALGLQAAPQMIRQHGGLDPGDQRQRLVDAVGMRLVERSAAARTEWQYEFHLLADTQTINAFALPGGQCFITAALFDRLETEGQLAGVLGHEIGHVVARHGAQKMAKSKLTQGLTGAVLVATDSAESTLLTQMIAQMVNMKYGRDDELQSDELGVRFMADAGYDPRAMLAVMRILAEASSGSRPPEFFSTHPNPDNRLARIERAIGEVFPGGVPAGLEP
ncbi:MAG: M48 family metalloprotease [Phycisphaerales bacterium]|nr:M48 family metalloprotease [Phycisphaerales bacterium]